MALVTASAEIAFVYVIAAVTVDAAPGGNVEAVHGFVVTTVAVNFEVRMPESEARVIVIEAPDQPGIRIVALRAIFTQAALMNIVAAMTDDAF